MLRALGKVIEVKETGKEKTGSISFRIRARVAGEAHPALKLPPGLKGRCLWVERVYRERLRPRKGDFIVITYDELSSLIKWGREPLVPGKVFREDVDADGFPEITFETDLFRCSGVAPRRGKPDSP